MKMNCFLVTIIFLIVYPTSAFGFIGRSVCSCSRINRLTAKKDTLDELLIDESKLSDEEKDRLVWIKKLSSEADEIVRAGGFNYNTGDEYYKEAGETNFSGQSTVERSIISKNDWGDLFASKILASGDISALLVFAAIGRSNHGEDTDVLSTLSTAAPFVSSWLLLSPFLGAYNRKATESLAALPSGLLPGWLLSVPAALAIRGILKGEIPPTPFIIVSMVATFTLLCAWRAVYIGLFGSTSDKEYKSAGAFEVFSMIRTLLRRW